MKLSTRTRYGTRALIEIARNYKKCPTKRKDIAKTQDISEGYLENILSALKSWNIVSTIRGADGGFVLDKPPSQIKVLDIVLALEGTVCPVECLERPGLCDKVPRCLSRRAWQKLYEAQIEALSGITLQDLLDREKTDFGIINYII